MFIALGLSSDIYGHSVQVGYCVSCTGELTLYVEHWHSNEDPSSTTMTLEININGVISTVTGSPTVNLQDTPLSSLPGCVNPVNIFASCSGQANTYNDWVVYTFPALPCGVPITIKILSGNTVFTEDGCGMYPATSPVIMVPCNVNPPPVATSNNSGGVCGSSSADITLTGFIAAIQWQSAPASTGPWTNIPGANSSPLSTGTLTTTTFYRALETGGCESNTVGVTIYQAPVSNAGADITTCPTANPGNLGTANNSSYTYLWSPPGGLSSATVSNPSVLLDNTVNITYTVTTTAFGCTSSDSVIVIVNPIPISNAGPDITTCISGISGSIGTAPTPGYTYSWTPAAGLSNAAAANPDAALNVPGTKTYIVTTTALNCNSKDTVVVVVNPLPTAVIAGTTAVCKGDAAPNINFTGAAGTAPYTFTYSINGGTNQTITTTSGNSITAAVPTTLAGTTTYSLVSVQDASSTVCSQLQSGSAAVTVNPLPTAAVSGTTTVCKNDASPSITFTGAAATAPYTFTYTINGAAQPAVSTTSGNSVSVSVPTSATGIYIYALVSVQDASSTSCSQAQSGSASVTVNPLPTAALSGTTTLCKNDPAPTITFTGAAGTPPYTFTYTINSGANQTISTAGGNSVNLTVPTNTAIACTYALISVHDASPTSCSQIQNGSATITVNPLPTATITGTTAVCKNAASPNITFTGASASAPYTFTYTINGVTQPTATSIGNSVTIAAPTSAAGTFTYSLVSVEDASPTACSQVQSGTAAVIVNPLPTAIIGGTKSVCRYSSAPNIIFTGASGTPPYTFTYTINNGTNQTVTTTSGNSVNVPAPTNIVGSFVYDLVSVQDASITACSQLQSGSAAVTINPLPIADYNFTNICLTQAMLFNDLSTVSSGNIVHWSWNFGDSSPADTSQNAVYIYANSGMYNVSLITTTNNGCKDTIAKNIVVHPNPNAQCSSANVCDGTSVGFNDLSTIPATDTLQSWTWNFGDDSPINTNQSVAGGHLYPGPGSYTIHLFVVSNFGCSDTITREVVINPNPSVAFSANDTAGCELLCLNFQDASSILTGSNILWAWNIGDGSSSTNSQNFDHCYSNDSVFSPISFNISLTVASDSGCISSLTKNNYITVYPNPNADFTVNPETSTIINPVISFIDGSSGADFWHWNFGDLDTSSGPNPLPHTYSDTGTYTIMLITSTQYGCIDTAYQNIKIDPDFTLYIPNAFSPNNDGVNDTFSPKGIFITEYEMTIFDRWGNLIFFTDEFNKPWDGKANDGAEMAQKDVYIYVIKGTDIYRKKHNYKGIVTLVR